MRRTLRTCHCRIVGVQIILRDLQFTCSYYSPYALDLVTAGQMDRAVSPGRSAAPTNVWFPRWVCTWIYPRWLCRQRAGSEVIMRARHARGGKACQTTRRARQPGGWGLQGCTDRAKARWFVAATDGAGCCHQSSQATYPRTQGDDVVLFRNRSGGQGGKEGEGGLGRTRRSEREAIKRCGRRAGGGSKKVLWPLAGEVEGIADDGQDANGSVPPTLPFMVRR